MALLAGLAVWPRAAGAAPPEPPLAIDLTYAAPAECPGRDELTGEVRQRVDPTWQAGFDRRTFAVRIERLPDGAFSGRLEVSRANRELEARELRAATCREVSAALVVFIAIALDPANADADASAPASPGARANEPPAPPLPGRPARAESPPPRPPTSRGARVPRARPSAWVVSSGIGAAYLHAPQDAWGARVDLQLARIVRSERVAPALRLSWGFADFDAFPANGGRASFRFETARASACALVELAPVPVTVAPCVGVDLGSLTAKSTNLPQVGHASSTWYALGGLVRASWLVLSWLSVEGEVGLEAPFARTTFALTEPVRIVYRPPSIFLTAGAGIAMSARFP